MLDGMIWTLPLLSRYRAILFCAMIVFKFLPSDEDSGTSYRVASVTWTKLSMNDARGSESECQPGVNEAVIEQRKRQVAGQKHIRSQADRSSDVLVPNRQNT